MAEARSVRLLKGEKIEWEVGNLVCVQRPNGKFRFASKNPRAIIINPDNKWVYGEEFDYISKPENYVLIVRKEETSRLLNLLYGKYITSARLYIKEYLGEKKYLAWNIDREKEIIFDLVRMGSLR